MHDLNLALAISAFVVIALGLLSAAIKRSILSIPLLALAAGIIAGPQVLGWLDPDAWPHRDTYPRTGRPLYAGHQRHGIALRTPVSDFRRLLMPVTLLLTLGMLGTWLASTLLAWWVLG